MLWYLIKRQLAWKYFGYYYCYFFLCVFNTSHINKLLLVLCYFSCFFRNAFSYPCENIHYVYLTFVWLPLLYFLSPSLPFIMYTALFFIFQIPSFPQRNWLIIHASLFTFKNLLGYICHGNECTLTCNCSTFIFLFM